MDKSNGKRDKRNIEVLSYRNKTVAGYSSSREDKAITVSPLE